MSLKEYNAKRHFNKTKEPAGKVGQKNSHIFVIQKHHASHLHYDFRLELDGVLKSWAVPKEPPKSPKEKRLAVEVEDHPVSYANFEGDIPEGEYGAGHVEIWDKGTWSSVEDPKKQLKKGRLDFELKGKKMKGRWLLIRTKTGSKKPNWLLIKRSGDEAHVKPTQSRKSVKTKTTSKAVQDSLAGSIPTFVQPELCVLMDKAPNGSDWIHEIKYDGYRSFCRKNDDDIKILTRRGLDWSERFPSIWKECQKIKAKSTLLDGEIAWVDAKGRSHFNGLQNAMGKTSDEIYYYVFDILFLDGKDLRQLPLIERKSILKKLIVKSKLKQILFSDHQQADGADIFKSACKRGLEGIVSKKSDSTYESGRGGGWVKTKCINTQEFVIGGFTYQKEKRVIGALLVGEYDEQNHFQYVGRLGTGFSKANLPGLTKKLKELAADENPFESKVPQSKNVHWVKPDLVANVEFGAWTEDHILRHAAFKGLREDKPADEVMKENLKEVQISHPEKVIFEKQNIKKIDLVNYYKEVRDYILPHAMKRPMALLRCPSGEGQSCFFQKHLDESDAHIQIGSLNELLELIQINSLELHTWNSRVENIDRPDQIVFDLDPDPTVEWKDVKTAAYHLKDILEQLGLESFIKVSGNKGLHIHVPIKPQYSWDEIKNFSRSVCNELVEQYPDKYTVNILKKDRKNKIFLDYLRNSSGSTAVVPYSLRNNPKASVALPIEWDELKSLKSPSAFSIDDVIQRIKKGKDPWREYFKVDQSIRLLDISRQAMGHRV